MSDEGINEEVSREVVSNQEVDEVDRGIVDTTIGRLIQSTIAPFTTTKRPGPMATDVTTTPLKMLRLQYCYFLKSKSTRPSQTDIFGDSQLRSCRR
jgi:hypothetical protein